MQHQNEITEAESNRMELQDVINSAFSELEQIEDWKNLIWECINSLAYTLEGGNHLQNQILELRLLMEFLERCDGMRTEPTNNFDEAEGTRKMDKIHEYQDTKNEDKKRMLQQVINTNNFRTVCPVHLEHKLLEHEFVVKMQDAVENNRSFFTHRGIQYATLKNHDETPLLTVQ